MKITDKEMEVLNHRGKKITPKEVRVINKLEDKISVEEKCINCGGSIIGDMGIIMCEDCGFMFSIEDYIENRFKQA